MESTESPAAAAGGSQNRSLDDELGVPPGATVVAAELAAIYRAPPRLETSGGRVAIALDDEACIRPDGRSWVVGRQAAASDIRIQHKSISRKHAVLYVLATAGSGGGGLFLKDLGGKHGTTVNGRKLDGDNSVVELKDGDSVMFGNVRESVFRVKIAAKQSDKEQQSPEEDTGRNEEGTDPGAIQQKIIEKAGEGLTGREKRQAEIAAMMASLEQAPTYQKKNVPDLPATEDGNSGTARAPQEAGLDDAARQVIEKHDLPVSNRFSIPSESERKNTPTCVAIDQSGSRFVVGSTDSRLRYYDFGGMDRRNQSSFKEIIPDDGYLLVDCAFSNTGDRVLVGTSSVQPRVYDRDGSGEIIKFMRGDMYVADQSKTVGHTATVTGVDWHPLERDIVLTSSNDGSARIWNLNGKTQFQMLVCEKVFQAKSERGQRTAIKSVCFHPGGREFAVGTACGSIQVWSRSRASGRPERALFDAHGSNKKPVTSLAYSIDGSKLVSRSSEDDTVRVWNAQRLSRSFTPLVVCSGAETVHESSNACFSPNGKIVCSGSSSYKKKKGGSEGQGRVESGFLLFYDVSTPSDVPVKPILSCPLDGNSSPVITKWHSGLNQVFVACADGGILIFYDPELSTKGALLPAAKVGRGVDGLSELLRSRVPQGSAGISGDIVTPFTLPMYRDNTVSEKKRKRQERKDPVLSKEPERPATGKHKTGAQEGTGKSFQQFVADQTGKTAKVIAGKDPREALFKYKGEGNEGNERNLAKKTAEEEEEELHSKRS